MQGVSEARGPYGFRDELRRVNFLLPSARLRIFPRFSGEISQNAKGEFCFIAKVLLAPGRIPDHFHLDQPDPFNPAHGVLDQPRHHPGHRAGGAGQRHVDDHVPVAVDFNPVDQAEVVDVEGQLGITNAPQGRHDSFGLRVLRLGVVSVPGAGFT